MNRSYPPSLAATPAAELRPALLANRERTLTELYQRTFPAVRRHVCRCGGSADDARDVFHDALVIFYEKAVAGTLELSAPAGSYLQGICHNLWRRELTRRGQHPGTELGPEHELLLSEEPAPTAEEESFAVLDYVARLGERCRSILLSFYYFQQPLEQIAATHQYRSVRSATVQKFKCLERLRESVRTAWQEAFA